MAFGAGEDIAHAIEYGWCRGRHKTIASVFPSSGSDRARLFDLAAIHGVPSEESRYLNCFFNPNSGRLLVASIISNERLVGKLLQRSKTEASCASAVIFGSGQFCFEGACRVSTACLKGRFGDMSVTIDDL